MNVAQYPHMFDDAVIDNVKERVMDESAGFSGEDHNSKREYGRSEASDFQMLKTYSIGLLAYLLEKYAFAMYSLFFSLHFLCDVCI